MAEAQLSTPQEQVRQHWAYRLIQRLRGNQTLMGALVIAIVQKMPSNPPRILTGGLVNKDGILIVSLERRQFPGTAKWVALGPVDGIRDEFRRLMDGMGLSDAEHLAFFDAMRRWIVRDKRARAPTLH